MGEIKLSEGDKYGLWTVIKEVGRDKFNRRQVLCKCSCEKQTIRAVEIYRLIKGKSKSCGCLRKINRIKAYDKKSNSIIGQKFGRVTIIEKIGKDKWGSLIYSGECDCDGDIKNYNIASLRSGKTQSCGCYKREVTLQNNMNYAKDAVGNKYNRLTVIKEIERDKNFNQRMVLAECECDGNIKKYNLNQLKFGSTTSCGCYGRERTKETKTYQVRDYQEKHSFFCIVEEIMDDPEGYGILTKCKYCSEWFKPEKWQIQARIGVLERPKNFLSEKNIISIALLNVNIAVLFLI